MFDFLKKKLKESIDGIKKVFTEKEEPKEEVASFEEKIEETKQLIEEKEEIISEQLEELKEEEKSAPVEEKPIIEQEIEKIEEKIDVLEEEEKELEQIEEIEKKVEKAIEETPKPIGAEEKQKEEERIEPKEEIKVEEKPVKKQGFFSRIFKKKEEKPKEKPKTLETEEETAEVEKPAVKPKFSLFEKKLSEEEFEKFFRGLEISFLEANIAYEVIQLVKEELKKEIVDKPVKWGKVEDKIIGTITDTFKRLMIGMEAKELLERIEANKEKGEPTKFLFLGVNGVGKTTNMCKLGYWLQQKGYSIVLSASDTFRAASIEQLEKHASNLNVKVIKHKYGADPAAVAFDAIQHAKANKIDVVLIDSAGRQHSNANLMDELAKIKRVAKPDITIFVADALTGNDAVEQAREFGKTGYDAIILGKADVDQKGGAILSVSYVSGKPILFLGMGQDYKDLEAFDKDKLIKRLIK